MAWCPPDKAGSIVSAQGVKMGRPSRIHIRIDLTGSEITRVRVGGTSVLVGEGRPAIGLTAAFDRIRAKDSLRC